MNNPSAQELLDHIENKISQKKYKDSVHKITLMTARDVIKKILENQEI
jgi:hypothetical protein